MLRGAFKWGRVPHPSSRGKMRRLGLLLLTLAIVIPAAGPSIARGTGESPTSTYSDEILADNPAAYWRLGEATGTVASDQLGGNPGSYRNGVTLGQPGPLVGDTNTAVSFDGANDFVTVPHSSALNATSGVTVEGWIKRSKSGAWQVVVGKPGTGQSRNEHYALWFNPSGYELASRRDDLRQRDREAVRRRGAESASVVVGPADGEHAAAEHGAPEHRLKLVRRLAR
jgi:hypothetical protein